MQGERFGVTLHGGRGGAAEAGKNGRWHRGIEQVGCQTQPGQSKRSRFIGYGTLDKQFPIDHLLLANGEQIGKLHQRGRALDEVEAKVEAEMEQQIFGGQN